MAGGFLIELSENEFILCGSGYSVKFLPKPGEKAVVGVLNKEEGYYRAGEWVPGRTLNGDEGYFIGLSISRRHCISACSVMNKHLSD